MAQITIKITRQEKYTEKDSGYVKVLDPKTNQTEDKYRTDVMVEKTRNASIYEQTVDEDTFDLSAVIQAVNDL